MCHGGNGVRQNNRQAKTGVGSLEGKGWARPGAMQ
jgi:hypothetical protein